MTSAPSLSAALAGVLNGLATYDPDTQSAWATARISSSDAEMILDAFRAQAHLEALGLAYAVRGV